ncbi:MAG: hypothetical protein KKF02_11345, partial [Proteobacteria bacterium]|nr:hypothetical protein [Pseudomonadota bacterium]
RRSGQTTRNKDLIQARPDPPYAAISLPMQKQRKDEAQRSIRTFYEVVNVALGLAATPVVPSSLREVR